MPYLPIRLSRDTPKLTALSSIPISLHNIPISLKNDIFNDKKQFDVYFIISAALGLVTIIFSVRGLYNSCNNLELPSKSSPIITLSGIKKSSYALSCLKNSGL